MDSFIDEILKTIPPPIPSRLDRYIDEILSTMKNIVPPVLRTRKRQAYLEIEFVSSSSDRKIRIPRKLNGSIDDETYKILTEKKKLDRDLDRNIINRIGDDFGVSELLGDLESLPYIVDVKKVSLRPTNVQRPINQTTIRKKQSKGNKQDTVNTLVSKYLKFGKVCHDKYYIENGCMISCFLEVFDSRLTTFRNLLNPLSLYTMATGRQFNGDYGLSLLEITEWMKKWRLDLLCIDINGKIIYEYRSPKPNRNVLGGWVYRIMIHNEHVWNITENLHEFDMKISKGFNVAIKNEVQSKELTNWIKLKPYEEKNYQSLSSLEELRLKDSNLFISNNIEYLFSEFWSNGYEPSNIKLIHGIVNSFDVRYEDRQLSIRPPVNVVLDSQPVISMIENMSLEICRTMIFDKYLYELRSLLMPNNAISTYSPSLYENFKRYSRGAVVCHLSRSREEKTYEIDINRAYTKSILEITSIPVFNVFDVFVPFSHSRINPLSFYIVSSSSNDPIILPNKFDCITGETVQYLLDLNRSFSILYVCECQHSVPVNLNGKIEEIYNNNELTSQNKKDLLNILYGLTTKSKNKIQKGQCYTSKSEFNGDYIEHKNIGCVVVKTTTMFLKDGFLPISRIILDKHRIRLHKIYTSLDNCYGIRTDALYVSSLPSGKFSSSKNFSDIGSLRLTKKSFQHLPPYVSKCVEPFICHREINEQKLLKDEYKTVNDDWIEFDNLITNKTIIRGLVGGVGKSYSLKRYFQRYDKNYLTITPWNMLADDCNGITLYKLLGEIPDELLVGENKKKKYSLDGITDIVFEEVFLYNIKELTMIKSFIDSNPSIQFYATGDSSQLAPINCNYSVDYINECVDSIFTNCIMLTISKRVKDISEAKTMINIANILREDLDGKMSLDSLKILCDKITTCDISSIDTSIPQICYLRKTLEKINSLCHKSADKYFIGQELLGTGINSISNVSYRVIDMNDEFITISFSERKGKEKTYTYDQANKYFRYSYGRTVHACQGLSLGDKIYIHDYDFSRVNNRWIYTAITRCSSLDIVFVV
jgi:hypothetical protein